MKLGDTVAGTMLGMGALWPVWKAKWWIGTIVGPVSLALWLVGTVMIVMWLMLLGGHCGWLAVFKEHCGHY